jgi:hypothetical protein
MFCLLQLHSVPGVFTTFLLCVVIHSTQRAGYGSIRVGSFLLSYQPVFPFSTQLDIALTFTSQPPSSASASASGSAVPPAVYESELSRVLSAIAFRQSIDFLYLQFTIDFYSFQVPYSLEFPAEDGVAPLAHLTSLSSGAQLPSADCSATPSSSSLVSASLTAEYNNWFPVHISVLQQSTTVMFIASTSPPPPAAPLLVLPASISSALEPLLLSTSSSLPPPLLPARPPSRFTSTLTLTANTSQPIDTCALLTAMQSAGASGAVFSSNPTPAVAAVPLALGITTWQMQALNFVVNLTQIVP